MNFVIHIYYYLLQINKIYYFQKKGLNTLIMIINNVSCKELIYRATFIFRNAL